MLPTLENATSGWTNVNTQTYTMGSTNFNGTNAYTGCNNNLNCTTNKYTLGQRSGKAQMITLQEAVAVGCTTSNRSCPVWMYDYLNDSASYGGTTSGTDYRYWTMSAHFSSSYSNFAWRVLYGGDVGYSHATFTRYGARAVVVVSK